MHSSATSKPPPLFLRLPTTKLISPNRNPNWIQPNSKPNKLTITQSPSLKNSLRYFRNNSNSNQEPSSLPFPQNAQENTNLKLQSLASEFKSLPEPIDRVKRLLHYAALLPPLDESTRVDSNRVRGCTTQVWLEVRMDSDGLMRFKIDSDSEITKGFCSCLIWVLDGAAPEEVAAVTADDLADMNVGGFSGGQERSRVNIWANVLMSMKKRTRDLVEERERVQCFPGLVAKIDDHVSANGTYAIAKVCC
ncbi:hypothetical protein C3L33_13949, partial [Rhododendron williamsianum]